MICLAAGVLPGGSENRYEEASGTVAEARFSHAVRRQGTQNLFELQLYSRRFVGFRRCSRPCKRISHCYPEREISRDPVVRLLMNSKIIFSTWLPEANMRFMPLERKTVTEGQKRGLKEGIRANLDSEWRLRILAVGE